MQQLRTTCYSSLNICHILPCINYVFVYFHGLQLNLMDTIGYCNLTSFNDHVWNKLRVNTSLQFVIKKHIQQLIYPISAQLQLGRKHECAFKMSLLTKN